MLSELKKNSKGENVIYLDFKDFQSEKRINNFTKTLEYHDKIDENNVSLFFLKRKDNSTIFRDYFLTESEIKLIGSSQPRITQIRNGEY